MSGACLRCLNDPRKIFKSRVSEMAFPAFLGKSLQNPKRYKTFTATANFSLFFIFLAFLPKFLAQTKTAVHCSNLEKHFLIILLLHSSIKI